jgi:hypothetical protein
MDIVEVGQVRHKPQSGQPVAHTAFRVMSKDWLLADVWVVEYLSGSVARMRQADIQACPVLPPPKGSRAPSPR